MEIIYIKASIFFNAKLATKKAGHVDWKACKKLDPPQNSTIDTYGIVTVDIFPR